MNIFKLSLANLRFHALNSFFNTLILVLGIATIITLLHISQQLEQRFTRDLEGIDLVVGAKGSPIQLILSSVFHLDIPNGNIPLDEAEKLEKNPLIKSAIPLALGDNFQGFRIVGTDSSYIDHYHGQLAEGRIFNKKMEITLGSEVARISHMKLGGTIIPAHGLINSDDLHTDFPYTVVGILKPTGTVLDRLLLTPVESVWYIHQYPDADNPEEIAYKKVHPGKELTSLLITYKSPYAAVTLPRMIDKSSSMQAASPAFEVAHLLSILGFGSDAVAAFGLVLVVIAGLGFFITLWGAVNERRYDIALMRSLGATRSNIFMFVLSEGIMLGLGGLLFGLVLGHGFAWLLKRWVEVTRHMELNTVLFHPYEIYVIGGAIVISIIAAIIPALTGYRMNIAHVLSKG